MAKIVPSIVRFSGKLDKQVHVDSNRYPRHVRSAPKEGSKKNEPGLKEQYRRTAYLNRLASELNQIMRTHSDYLKPSSFYAKIQSLFRKEPSNNRFRLLRQLNGIDIHPSYPLSRLSNNEVSVNKIKNKLTVCVEAQSVPFPGKYEEDCHHYEVLLITWAKGNEPAIVSRQYSEWCAFTAGKPSFEFEFPVAPGRLDWVVCLRQRLGKDQIAIDTMSTEGMAIVNVGTNDKKQLALIEKEKNAEKKAAGRKKREEPERVKAKEWK